VRERFKTRQELEEWKADHESKRGRRGKGDGLTPYERLYLQRASQCCFDHGLQGLSRSLDEFLEREPVAASDDN